MTNPTKSKEITTREMELMITLNNFHKALNDSDLMMVDIQNMCLNMYKMGQSPLTVVRKFLGKYDLGNIKVIFVDSNKYSLNELPKTLGTSDPALLVYLNQTVCGEILSVALKYYPALRRVSNTKYKLINFTSTTLV